MVIWQFKEALIENKEEKHLSGSGENDERKRVIKNKGEIVRADRS